MRLRTAVCEWRMANGKNTPREICPAKFFRAFTLLEVMMVVAILGLVLAMGIPSFLSILHKSPFRNAVKDTLDICTHARAQAILNGKTTIVVFHPLMREVTLIGDSPPNDAAQPVSDPQKSNSAQYDNSVIIEMLYVNLQECTTADEARVRFFPNGTSDEMTLVLHAGDQWSKISTELTTGITSAGPVK